MEMIYEDGEIHVTHKSNDFIVSRIIGLNGWAPVLWKRCRSILINIWVTAPNTALGVTGTSTATPQKLTFFVLTKDISIGVTECPLPQNDMAN